jgi:hypothetical protein
MKPSAGQSTSTSKPDEDCRTSPAGTDSESVLPVGAGCGVPPQGRMGERPEAAEAVCKAHPDAPSSHTRRDVAQADGPRGGTSCRSRGPDRSVPGSNMRASDSPDGDVRIVAIATICRKLMILKRLYPAFESFASWSG